MRDLEYRIIYCLDKEREGITGKRIADECACSVNTVRNCLQSIRPELARNGLKIQSKTAKGYILEFEDRDKGEEYIKLVRSRISNPIFGKQTSENYKVNYIIRRLLSSQRKVPLEILCTELFYSVSSVRREFVRVEEILSEYQLSLKIKRGEGYYIEGNEWDKRLCLLAQHKIFVNLDKSYQELEPDFIKLFGIGNEDIRKLRHRIRDAIVESNCFSYKMYQLPILTNYIVLMQSRRLETDGVYISEKQEEIIDNSGAALEASRILKSARIEEAFTDKEKKTFAMFLLAYRNVTSVESLKTPELDESRREADELWKVIENIISLKCYATEEIEKEFICCTYCLHNRLIFHIHPDPEDIREFTMPNVVVEDLILQLSAYLKGKYGVHVSVKQLTGFYYVLLKVFEKKMNYAFSYDAVLVSSYGYGAASYLAAQLLEHFSFYFKSVTPIEYTQLAVTTPEKKILIHDLKPDTLKPVYKSTFHEEICLIEQDIHSEFLKKIGDWISKKNNKIVNQLCHHNFLSVADMDEAIENIMLYFRNEMVDDDYNKLEKWLYLRLRNSTFQMSKETIILTAQVPTEYNGIYDFHLQKDVIWKGRKWSRVLCVLYRLDEMETIFHMMSYVQNNI